MSWLMTVSYQKFDLSFIIFNTPHSMRSSQPFKIKEYFLFFPLLLLYRTQYSSSNESHRILFTYLSHNGVLICNGAWKFWTRIRDYFIQTGWKMFIRDGGSPLSLYNTHCPDEFIVLSRRSWEQTLKYNSVLKKGVSSLNCSFDWTLSADCCCWGWIFISPVLLFKLLFGWEMMGGGGEKIDDQREK